MRTVQISLTVNDGKWLIAHAIAAMDSVRQALEHGKIVFKGSTTVSCVSQLLTGHPLRISGRISPRGATASFYKDESIPHTMLWHRGQAVNLDANLDEALLDLGPGDVMITGANLIDTHGDAALMAGSPAGNLPGKSISAMTVEGFDTIVAAGLEKLMPGRVRDSILAARRKGVELSWGMSCGLFPVYGRVVTELEAVSLLADVQAAVIGRGGIHGAEGGCVLQVWGEEAQVFHIEQIVEDCKNRPVGGEEASLTDCSFPCVNCGGHLSCRYRKLASE